MNDERSFTLIELLVVIAIIGILAGLISTGVEAARKRAYRAQAQAMISTLEMAISMYKTDTGAFPPEDASTTTSKALAYKLSRGYTDTETTANIPSGWSGPYMEFKPSELSGGSAVDPWGRTYNYDVSPITGNTGTYNLWSEGPTTNSGDEVVNW